MRTLLAAQLVLLAGTAAASAFSQGTSEVFRDVNAVPHRLMDVTKGSFLLLFFVSHDCPISNYFSPEIRRICEEYAAQNVRCGLVYPETSLSDKDAREHASSFNHGSYPVFVDRDGILARTAGATVTPEATLLGPAGTVFYRGRIDDTYAIWGKRRSQPSQRDLRLALSEAVAGKPVSSPRVPAVGCWIPKAVPALRSR